MPADRADLRAVRTRSALLRAFFDIVQEGRYEDITIADIVTRAGVSRSAFYAHYSGKDALLAASIASPFSILSNTLRAENVDKLVMLLDHFREKRLLARSIFRDPIRRRVVAVLTDQVETILDEGGPWKRGPLILPSRIAATQLAEMLIAPVEAWLFEDSRCSSHTLAVGLRRVSVAALEGMAVPSRSGR